MVPTSVYLTIDTECSEERLVRGRIQPPIGYEVMMWGRFRNQPRPLGLELILAELRAHRLPCTFFVEALSAEVFGSDGLREVCTSLLEQGQDIQLHLHPNLRRPEWRAGGGKPLPDNIGDYPVDQQAALLQDGLAQLTACGVPREQLLAFRAGNFGASNRTWEALRQVGIPVDSSLNLTFLNRDCAIEWPTAEIDLFEPREGLWELPITNFRDGSWYSHLEITAVSYAEMVAALRDARANQVQHVTIVAHPAEFFTIDSAAERLGRPNRANIRRLHRLLGFLDSHRDEFAVTTVGDLARALRSGAIKAPVDRPVIPRGSRGRKALRMITQVAKRLDSHFGLV